MSIKTNYLLALHILILSLLAACGGSSGSSSGAGAQLDDDSSESITDQVSTEVGDQSSDGNEVDSTDVSDAADDLDTVNYKDAILIERNVDCESRLADYEASVRDLQNNLDFNSEVSISLDADECVLTANGIPNHDFNDESARFATDVSAINRSFRFPQTPSFAASASPLSQQSYDAVMLNGVVLDILSAGCYKPNDAMADTDGNVPVGCRLEDGWLLDPLSPLNRFGTDLHNAHTQPDGTYHYHGNPMALFDDLPGSFGSPVIGYAADGFPIYGSYFYDESEGRVRKALSGYELKTGERPSGEANPSGNYDGQYIDDYEFTGAGDLDECNGMLVNGQYAYYVSDNYPWVIACFKGEVNASFQK
ncbi:YHYH protein [Agaribacterium sp. ZY112]|uniref:YHYH protein n=1 Tax=Agaribacterium sp. ZY112 TaxID=3233574 RepID=UPI0035237490